MTTPPPAPFTADEYEPDFRISKSEISTLWATIRRALAILGALAIVAVLAGLAGYAVGRHSVAPKPGEEARLDSVVRTLASTADSARRAAEWEHAQRVIAEQRAAALPRVTVREPGVIVIGPTAGQLAPRVVPVPVEITAALDAERRVNAALRGELAAVTAEADAERARADSLARSRDLARAVRTPLLTAGLSGGRDMAGAWNARADVGVRVSDRWSLNADVTRPLVRHADTRGLVYLRWEGVRWP